MRFSQRLEIRQGQSLVMTPQLLQAIKLLQFSSIELASYVEAELERNPLLERADDPEVRDSSGEREGGPGSDVFESSGDSSPDPSGDSPGQGAGDGFGDSSGEGFNDSSREWGVAEL